MVQNMHITHLITSGSFNIWYFLVLLYCHFTLPHYLVYYANNRQKRPSITIYLVLYIINDETWYLQQVTSSELSESPTNLSYNYTTTSSSDFPQSFSCTFCAMRLVIWNNVPCVCTQHNCSSNCINTKCEWNYLGSIAILVPM